MTGSALIAQIRATMDNLRLVVYVNQDDVYDPIVLKLKDAKYEVVVSKSAIPRRAFIRNPDNVGILDLDTGEAFLGPNKVTALMQSANRGGK